jgi:hypothetical protein
MYSFFGLHHYLQQSGNTYAKWVNKHTQFILLSFSTTTIVSWLTFVSLRHTVETIEPEFIDFNIDWEAAFNIILFVIIPFFVAVTAWMITVPPFDPDKSSQTGSVSQKLLPSAPRSYEPAEVEYTAESILGMGDGMPVLGDSFTETDSLL